MNHEDNAGSNANPNKASFFDDDNLNNGFNFAKPDQKAEKDLVEEPILSSTLFTLISPNNNLRQAIYALHNRTLALYKDESSEEPEQILNLANSQFKPLPFNVEISCYGFSIVKNLIKYEFYAKEEQTIENWTNALKNVCVLTNFHDEYKAVKMIGKGSFAKVYLVESKSTGKHFAVKAFTKESLIISNKNNAKSSMINEIDIMRVLDHENVIKLYEVYETERSIYMVLELIQGKSLQEVLKKSGFKDNEARIANVISSILDALAYLASKGVMHRDLKPDNILLDKGDKVKIVDFGLATFIDVPEYIFKKCGTPGYIAPEVFKYDQKTPSTAYDDRCDAFSSGCILFYMLFGFLFFDGPNASEILKTNRKFTVDFQTLTAIKEELKNSNSKMSKDALDLLVRLLEFDPKNRLSAAQALNHPFLYHIVQQKIAGSFDVYQNGGYSPAVYDKRNSVLQEQILQNLKAGSQQINSPQRFAEKDSLYLDVGRPEITGKTDTITNGSANNSILLTKGHDNNVSTPNSASKFGKVSSPGKSLRTQLSGGHQQSFLKAAIFRNMQKNNEGEEAKDDEAYRQQRLQEIKKERRHSDFVSANTFNFPLINNKSAGPGGDGVSSAKNRRPSHLVEGSKNHDNDKGM